VRLTPYFSYDLTNVSSLVATINYTDVRYDEVFDDLLTDYADARFILSYRRAFSQRTTGILSTSYRNYQTDGGASEEDGVSITAGFERALSETTRLRAAAGLEDTKITATETDPNWIADVSISRSTELTRLLAQYRRSISASGIGNLVTRDSINLNFTRQLSEKISAGIGGRAYATNAVQDTNTTFDERDYIQLRAQLTWYFTRVLSFQVDYRYTFLDRNTLGESSNSNRVSLWLNYIPQPFVRSR